MDINTHHKQYQKFAKKWEVIENIVTGENIQQYLITLNPTDTSNENKARNKEYKSRAIFYRLAGMTVVGLLGSIFRKWPTFNAPDEMQYLAKNADGSGMSIYQCSQESAERVIGKGRAGVAVSFPKTNGQVSKADINSGRAVATIHHINPEDVINWREITDGAKIKLSLVVIKETREEPSGYAVNEVEVRREKYLDMPIDEEGNQITSRAVYRERTWIKGKEGWAVEDEHTPTDAAGKTWDEIPFRFIGSRNNSPPPDEPPVSGIVELNIGHYRNSADYEDDAHFGPGNQPWASGWTEEQLAKMRASGFYVGGRQMIVVPEGQQFQYATANPNTQARQAKLDKVDEMVSLGARMMQMGSATKTAAQVTGEREGQTSVIALIASNVSEAYTDALKWACRYMGADPAEAEYTLSQDFVNMKAEPQMIQQVVATWMQGGMPAPDYIAWMKRQELFNAETPDDDYLELLARPGIE